MNKEEQKFTRLKNVIRLSKRLKNIVCVWWLQLRQEWEISYRWWLHLCLGHGQ